MPRPTRPCSSIASASISVVCSDASPASSTSIATRRPCAAASVHIRRTCSRASASVSSTHGIPPTTSAPRSTASRTRSSAPGSRSRPSWGKATTWRSTMPRNSSRRASSGITPSSRAEVSTSANASTCRTPNPTAASTARRAFGSIHDRSYSDFTAEASSIAVSADPIRFPVYAVSAASPIRSSVCTLSRWRCPSTKLSVTRPPPASISSRPARTSSVTATMFPPSTPICQRPARPRSVASATTRSCELMAWTAGQGSPSTRGRAAGRPLPARPATGGRRRSPA